MTNLAYKLSKTSFVVFIVVGSVCSCSVASSGGENRIQGNDSLDPGIDSQQVLEENVRPGVFLEVAEKDKPNVSVDFAKGTSHEGPRVAEINIRHSENLTYTGVLDGPAISKANKQLIAQKKNDREVRLIILGQNINTLESGRLATLKFDRLNKDTARVEIVTDKPIFAPSEANEGLLVGDPVEF